MARLRPGPDEQAHAADGRTADNSDVRAAEHHRRAPGAQVLPPENGYVFIETKSGKTRCQLNTEEVGCEAQFTNPPVLDGVPANGVRVT